MKGSNASRTLALPGEVSKTPTDTDLLHRRSFRTSHRIIGESSCITCDGGMENTSSEIDQANGPSVQKSPQRWVSEVYNHTTSISEESLEILLCPMPRVHVGKAMHFGKYTPAYLNWRFFRDFILPSMTYKERSDNETFFDFGAEWQNSSSSEQMEKNVTSTTESFLSLKDTRKAEAKADMEMRKKVMLCLLNEMREFRKTDGADYITQAMKKTSVCWPIDVRFKPGALKKQQKILQELYVRIYGPRMNQFLNFHFETLDERLLEEYPKLFKLIRVIQHENLTLSTWLNFIGIDLNRHLNTEYVQESASTLTGPMQELSQTPLSTRMAPRCVRQSLISSHKRGHQRVKIIYPFRNSCTDKDKTKKEGSETKSKKHKIPLQPEFPPGSWCLSTKNMFLSVYISALNRFTDIPMAGAIVPYRVPIDRETRMHITIQKRILSRQCENYGRNESQITCIEGCLFVQVLQNISCTVPWLVRLKREVKFEDNSLKEKMKNMGYCDNPEDLAHTIRVSRAIFDETEPTKCHAKCPQDCKGLVITPRIVGDVGTDAGEQRMELIISNAMRVYVEVDVYGLGQFLAEVMGNVSFFLGISLIEFHDWLVGVFLWATGKIPFIPALKPLLRRELYTDGLCSCTETVEDDGEICEKYFVGERSSSDESSDNHSSTDSEGSDQSYRSQDSDQSNGPSSDSDNSSADEGCGFYMDSTSEEDPEQDPLSIQIDSSKNAPRTSDKNVLAAAFKKSYRRMATMEPPPINLRWSFIRLFNKHPCWG